MLNGVSLDQLRAFTVAVEEGSFSAAARRLGRAQSVVSELVGSLEAQLGLALFDRGGRYPKLTPQGSALLPAAQAVICGTDGLRARARGMTLGLEPELSVVVDVMFPLAEITAAARAFQAAFPGTPLRLHVEALGAAYEPVLTGRASLGVVGSLPLMPPGLAAETLAGIALTMVAAPDHPLAALAGAVPRAALARHPQLVLTDRSELSAGRDFGVMSPNTWRLGDLSAKHAFLRGGLGWGSLPLHMVAEDLAAGRLVRLAIEGVPASGMILPVAAVYPLAAPPGPAGRWFIERLRGRPAPELDGGPMPGPVPAPAG